MRLGCVYKRFLNAIFVFQNVKKHKGILDILQTENRVQKTFVYKAQKLDRLTFFMNFDRFGLYIVTLSERHFRFPKSQVILCITQHFEKRKSCSGNVAT